MYEHFFSPGIARKEKLFDKLRSMQSKKLFPHKRRAHYPRGKIAVSAVHSK
jgi:hypothetical protein